MTPWERELLVQQNALSPMKLLEGRWIGEGEAHEQSIISQLSIQFVLNHTLVEVREKTGAHEDICFYRFVPGSGYMVTHLMPGAIREHPVELLPTGGLEWVSGPAEPSVIWEIKGACLVQEVIWPGEARPEVRVVYRREPG